MPTLVIFLRVPDKSRSTLSANKLEFCNLGEECCRSDLKENSVDSLGYLGAFAIESTVPLACPCTTTAGVPVAPDAAPTYIALNAAGTTIASGTLSSSDTASKTGLRTGALAAASSAGFSSGNTYRLRYDYAVSTVARQIMESFSVL